MRKIIALSVLLLIQLTTLACEVCKKQQPKIARGITHGTGPQSDWDYLIVAITVLIVFTSLYYSVKWIMRPGEKENAHIKYSIFNLD